MKDIIDCIEEEEAVQIDEEIQTMYFNLLDPAYQYLCISDDAEDCEHRVIGDNVAYCTGNRQYET